MALKKKPVPKSSPQDEMVAILQDIRITLDEICELLKSELEESERETTLPPKDFSKENV